MPSLSTLLAARTRVFWNCHECGRSDDVDLPALIAARGPDLDLTDRHPPCRTPGCGYWVGFYAQDGQRTRALATPAGGRAESRRRTAWLAGGGLTRGRGAASNAKRPRPEPGALSEPRALRGEDNPGPNPSRRSC